ncbi:MAG: DUF6273 domain-containing protein [bacterium]|nr:DUF6273 domain-containing protein [bacterium]
MPDMNDNIANANIAEHATPGEGSSSQEQRAPAQFEIGSYVTFGRYPQNNGDTPEPIEWLVLKNDGETALLLSKYALDCKPYHNKATEISWADCDLRKWLNGDFLRTAFTDEELGRISESKIESTAWCCTGIWCDDSGIRDCSAHDKVFCLSREEADGHFNRNYFVLDCERLCRPTAYAVAHGAFKHNYNGCCRYWLRDKVFETRNIFRVNAFGYICSSEFLGGMIAVRPALRIKLQ